MPQLWPAADGMGVGRPTPPFRGICSLMYKQLDTGNGDGRHCGPMHSVGGWARCDQGFADGPHAGHEVFGSGGVWVMAHPLLEGPIGASAARAADHGAPRCHHRQLLPRRGRGPVQNARLIADLVCAEPNVVHL